MKIQYLLASTILATAATTVNAQEKTFWDTWSGSAEAGINFATGNTHKNNFKSALNLKQELEYWENKIALSGSSSRENGSRTEEKYRIGGETDYKFSPLTYVFGEAEYVNDQFSGYEYRITEALGVGHKLIDEETMRLDIKGSIGGRHTKEDTAAGKEESEVILKPAAEFDWDITDTLNFNQKLSSIIGSDKTISASNSSLSTNLIGMFDLKFAVDIEHVSAVPSGRKNTDTTTSLSLVYKF